MKVVFLDVDGVLNCESDFRGRRTTKVLCGEKISRLKALVGSTDAGIVLSSSWRNYDDHLKYLRGRLRKAGMRIMDATPHLTCDRLPRITRGHEIQAWLEKAPAAGGYAILDDCLDFLEEQMPSLVLTDPERGLSDEDVGKAVEILTRKEEKKNEIQDIRKLP